MDNKVLRDFLSKNNIDEKMLKSNKNYTREELSKPIKECGIYKEEKVRDMYIRDVVTTTYDVNEDGNLYDELDYLFQDSDGGYHGRSNSMLEYTKDNVLQGLLRSLEVDPIHYEEVAKGKYAVSKNGKHRTALLRALYSDEISKAKTQEEVNAIQEKYKVKAEVGDLDEIKTYSNYIIHTIDSDIRLIPERDKNFVKTGKSVLLYRNSEGKIYSDEEIINFVKSITGRIPIDILNSYKEDEEFRRFVDEKLDGTYIKKEVSKKDYGILSKLSDVGKKLFSYDRGER